MANDVKLQEGHPVDENLRPIKVGGKSTAIETAQHGNGARVNGDLEVTGDISGNIKDMVLEDVTVDSLTTNSIVSSGDITLDCAGRNVYIKENGITLFTFDTYYNLFKIHHTDAPSSDYFLIDVGAEGATTISTVDGGSAVAHLTIDPDGDIYMKPTNHVYINQAANTTIDLDASGSSGAGGSIKLMSLSDADDYFMIDTGTTGITTITTVDDDGTAADLTITADGDITLDSATGVFIEKQAGTEFSAANSAYAGMILGYSMIRNEQGYTGTNITDAVIILNQTSFTLIESVSGTKAGVTFIAPPSGKVEVEFSAHVYNSQEYMFFGLSTSNSSYTAVDDLHTYDNSGQYYGDETDRFTLTMKWVVEGLTAGTSYTYYVWYKVTAGTAYIYHGESYHHGAAYHMPPVITKVTALPATFSITGD